MRMAETPNARISSDAEKRKGLHLESTTAEPFPQASYTEYRKTKSEMQGWLVAQKIVKEILKEDEQKKRAVE